MSALVDGGVLGTSDSSRQRRLSFQLLKKANFLKNTILLGQIDMFLRIFEEHWYVNPRWFLVHICTGHSWDF